MRAEYPDYQFVVVNDSADYVRTALHNTLSTLIEGLITTGLVLFFFLRGWRSTASVIIAIPTSLISTFFVMYMAGFSFNMMSLMGMTLCVGILVDDSIVVLENIHRHLAKGEDAKEAAVTGRMEIGMAAIAIALCDVVRFPPNLFHFEHHRALFQAVRSHDRFCFSLLLVHLLHADTDAGIEIFSRTASMSRIRSSGAR